MQILKSISAESYLSASKAAQVTLRWRILEWWQVYCEC